MNLLLWAFAAYAFWIIPVKVNVLLGWDERNNCHFVVRMMGMPVVKKLPVKGKRGKTSGDSVFMSVLLVKDQIRNLFRTIDIKRINVDVLISLQDAAQTALFYSLVRTCLDVVSRGGLIHVDGRIRMNFDGNGSTGSLECIASARLGSIGIAAMRLGLAAARKRMMAEEEKNAASY